MVVSFLKKIVHNDAMQTDPHEIYSWRVLALACSSCFGAMSFGWDSAVISGVVVMEPFKRYVFKLADISGEDGRDRGNDE